MTTGKMGTSEMGTSRTEHTDSPMTPIVRVALVFAAVSIALVVIVMIGFGAKTSCTTGPPSDSPSCDAIDDWALAGLVAVGVAATLSAVRRQRLLVTLALTGVIVVIAGFGMWSVPPG